MDEGGFQKGGRQRRRGRGRGRGTEDQGLESGGDERYRVSGESGGDRYEGARRGWHQPRAPTSSQDFYRPRSAPPPQHGFGQPRMWGHPQAPSPVRSASRVRGQSQQRSHSLHSERMPHFRGQAQQTHPQTMESASVQEQTLESEDGGASRGKGRRQRRRKSKKDVEEITEGISGMSVQQKDTRKVAAEKPPERRKQEVQIVSTKPKTIKNKTGESGKPIQLLANYFPMEKLGKWILCLYHVDFSIEDETTRVKKQLLRQHDKMLGEKIFDGMQLYLLRRLPKPVTELISKKESTEEIVNIKITFIKELNPLDVQYLHILNIIMKRCQDYMGLKPIGRNFYDSKAGTTEPEYNITVWPGYSTSIRNFEEKIMLNVDITHRFLRKETMLDEISRLKRRNLQTLIGLVVMTTYNERTYTIGDVNDKASPRDKFVFRGENISYEDYYKQKYNIRIRDSTQPLLIAKQKKSDQMRFMNQIIYLVPELCIMTGLSNEMRSDFYVMKSLAQYMRMSPDRRVKALQSFNTRFQNNDMVKTELNRWDLKMSKEMVKVPGRILPDEKIFQGGREFAYNKLSSDWSREMRSLKMNRVVILEYWTFLYPYGLERDAHELLSTLQRVAGPIGMNINRPEMMCYNDSDLSEKLNTCAGKQLVLIILRSSRNQYEAIKLQLSVMMGIPSQCILAKTIFKKPRLPSVATKLAIQMNCKLGGEVWSLEIPIKDCMVIGYDAYHDTLTKGHSYGAVISSLNKTWTKYLGTTDKHSNKEELTDKFRRAVEVAMETYHKLNGRFPTKVIVFRDGVGEGQIGYVHEHEVASVRSSIENLSSTTTLAFVIVSKRINTRLFALNPGVPNNPSPGSVVDSVITLPERYDFFLVPQSVNQGTVTPTSFNVIEDTTGFKPDHMQRISYKLCHLYFNWQGTIRVPAPCMYAHKLAYISGTATHAKPNINLADKLWYL